MKILMNKETKLLKSARYLFAQKNRKDEADMWNFIVSDVNLPDRPSGDRLRRWAYKRWGIDFGDEYATCAPISSV